MGTGREEDNAKYDAKALEWVGDNPLLMAYYRSLSSKTSKTRETYVRYIKNYFDYLKDKGFDVTKGASFAEINIDDLNEYKDSTIYYVDAKGIQKKAGPSIRNGRISAIKNFFKYLEIREYITRNPSKALEAIPDNTHHEVVFLDEEETEMVGDNIEGYSSRFYNANDHWMKRDLAMFTLGVQTGLRESAIAQIDLDDVDLQNGVIMVIEKGNIQKPVYIGEELAEMLDDWINVRDDHCDESCKALFVSMRRRRITVDGIRHIVKKHTWNVGKHITPHKMRSTCAVHLYEHTGDIYAVAEKLGHHNVKNTMRYAVNTEKRQREFADINSTLGSRKNRNKK